MLTAGRINTLLIVNVFYVSREPVLTSIDSRFSHLCIALVYGRYRVEGTQNPS